jgi:hypothetical protein
MNERVEQPAAKAGVDKAVAKKPVATNLDCLRDQAPADKVQAPSDKIPATEAAIEALSSGGRLVGLMGCGLMAHGGKPVRLGLDTDEIQNVAGELFKFGQDKTGDKIGVDKLGQIIAATPGVRQFA